MAEKTVVTEVKNGIMTIRLNTPELDGGTTYIEQNLISDSFENAIKDDSIRLIIFTGTGAYFHTGGRVPKGATAEIKAAHTESVARFGKVMEKLNKPLIAAINGECSAGGFSILSEADAAIAVDSAKFGFSEALRGGFSAMILTHVMDIIPKKRLLPCCYTGKLFSAQDAYMYGLVTEVVPEAELWNSVKSLSDDICRMKPELLKIGRKCFMDMIPMEHDDRVSRAKAFLTEVLEIQTKN